MKTSLAKNNVLADVFLVPHNDNIILYAPLKKRAILISRDTLIHIEKFLINPAHIMPDEIKKFLFAKNLVTTEFQENLPPTELNLLLTSDCNLRCKYCFSLGGETKNYMTWEIAKAAIDYVYNNAIKHKKEKLTIYFQGSGEPTLNWDVLVKSVEYGRMIARSKGLKTNFKITTNGIFSKEKAEWLAKNMDFATLSFDGPAEIQNDARCFPNGSGTLDIIFNNVKIFDKFGAKYNLHSVVTNSSVNRMTECVEFFADNFKTKYISFYESECLGNASLESKWGPPTEEEFLINFLKARSVGERKAVGVYYNKANLLYFFTRFSGSGRFFIIGPSGAVAAINEADDISRPLGKEFTYGQFKDGAFLIDCKKLQKLNKIYMRNVSFCKRCFCVYNCCVGYLKRRDIKSFRDFKRINGRKCTVIREIIKDELVQLIETGNKTR